MTDMGDLPVKDFDIRVPHVDSFDQPYIRGRVEYLLTLSSLSLPAQQLYAGTKFTELHSLPNHQWNLDLEAVHISLPMCFQNAIVGRGDSSLAASIDIDVNTTRTISSDPVPERLNIEALESRDAFGRRMFCTSLHSEPLSL